MKTKKYTSLLEELNVLVVGNNPIELGRVFDSLNRVPGKRIITEIAFDLKTVIERLAKFTPHFILIDDNIGQLELRNSVQALLRYRKTKSIPITVLKNSNYHEAINSGVLNYILKENLTGESLYVAFKNSIKFRQTQLYLYKAYRKRKGQLLRLISG
jgi:hypothetical protein